MSMSTAREQTAAFWKKCGFPTKEFALYVYNNCKEFETSFDETMADINRTILIQYEMNTKHISKMVKNEYGSLITKLKIDFDNEKRVNAKRKAEAKKEIEVKKEVDVQSDLHKISSDIQIDTSKTCRADLDDILIAYIPTKLEREKCIEQLVAYLNKDSDDASERSTKRRVREYF